MQTYFQIIMLFPRICSTGITGCRQFSYQYYNNLAIWYRSCTYCRFGTNTWLCSLLLSSNSGPATDQADSLRPSILYGIVESQRKSAYDRLYWPLFSYLHHHYDVSRSRQARGHEQPLLMGLSAPQGCGKTTTTLIMRELFGHLGINCVNISLDDFYLTGEDQEKLAKEHPSNPLLQYRGNAGTHDLRLLKATLDSLKASRSEDKVTSIPRYDKSLRGGRGDRLPLSQWTAVCNPDIVLLEGWMLGFKALPDGCDRLIDRNLKELNDYMKDYFWLERYLDLWVVVAVPSIDFVYEWRLEAEKKMLKETGKGLSDSQVRDFVSRFMPAYELYLPELYASVTNNTSEVPKLKITMSRERLPLSFSEPLDSILQSSL